jgi:pimeloyl-ACP methyl ester carboxylesterase
MTPSSTQPARRVLLRITGFIVAFLTLAAALIAGILAPYYLSARFSTISLLTILAIAAFGVVAWLGTRVCAALWRTKHPARLATLTSGALTFGFFGALYLLVLRPTPLHFTEVKPAQGAQSWHLPTGSTISYQEFLPPANIPMKPEPIVFLHGGPGLRSMPFDRDAYGPFAADGFRVYLYDQAGSGASDFLAHIKDYTIDRFVDDLEAIRLQLHAERMILIGHSMGSVLAARYIAKYPTHVSKVVFHSPAPIWDAQDSSRDMSRTDAKPLGLSSIPFRLLAGMSLMEQNPDAADNLLPQRQAEELMGPVVAKTVGALVCKGNSSKLPSLLAGISHQSDNPGFNLYVQQRLIDQMQSADGDPHTALRGNRTPAILLFGECNYAPWEGAVDYRRTFTDLKIFYIPKAAHYIQFEQPEIMNRVIRSFLLDQPDAIPPYTSDADPRSPAN